MASYWWVILILVATYFISKVAGGNPTESSFFVGLGLIIGAFLVFLAVR